MKLFWICLGGAVGTGARYLVGASFPHGILAVNIIGSFLISFVMSLNFTSGHLSPEVRVILTTGVLGGFTTYSSFNYETLQYLQNGETLRGIGNIFLMVVVCLFSGFLGLILARRF